MPSYLLCEDEDVFNEFVSAIQVYLGSFVTDEYYTRIASITNSNNPFAFNETSNKQCMKCHILVFCRVKVNVERDLYIWYCKLGYLDSNHTMGMCLFLASKSSNN